MNEETTVPSEGSDLQIGEAVATEVSETAPETADWVVGSTAPEPSQEATVETIWEDLSGAAFDETVAETTEPVLTVEVIENSVGDIVHAGLFGNFLICGTLIGVTLLRDRYGS